MLAFATQGLVSEGDWLVAETQTAGRGRMGRTWQSPTGNFYGSTLVILRPDDPPASALSLAASLGLFVAVGDPAHVKWPNDLLIGRAKVAGILLERQGDAVVMGFGVNIASAPKIEGRETTCLDVDGNLDATVDDMLDWLVKWVPWGVSMWREQGVAALCRRWEEEAHPRGTPLNVNLPDGQNMNGQFDGLTDDGALRLRLADGAIRVIHAGDVFLI